MTLDDRSGNAQRKANHYKGEKGRVWRQPRTGTCRLCPRRAVGQSIHQRRENSRRQGDEQEDGADGSVGQREQRITKRKWKHSHIYRKPPPQQNTYGRRGEKPRYRLSRHANPTWNKSLRRQP